MRRFGTFEKTGRIQGITHFLLGHVALIGLHEQEQRKHSMAIAEVDDSRGTTLPLVAKSQTFLEYRVAIQTGDLVGPAAGSRVRSLLQEVRDGALQLGVFLRELLEAAREAVRPVDFARSHA